MKAVCMNEFAYYFNEKLVRIKKGTIVDFKIRNRKIIVDFDSFKLTFDFYTFTFYFRVLLDNDNRIPKIQVFIIGSLSQEARMQEIAIELSEKNYMTVDHVHAEPGKIFSEIVSDVFDKIEKSDIIIALQKPDGSFDPGTIYELEYAKRLHKDIEIYDK